MGKYYTDYERVKIETLLLNKVKPKEIARQLGRHYTSVYREIKRGTVILIDSDLKPYKKYCADVGQRKMIDAGHNKGADLKIGNDFETLNAAEKLIKNERYSPYAVSIALKKTKARTQLCKATIYNYIHNGIFLNLTEKDLIYKTKKKKSDEKRTLYDNTGKKTIDERPKDISKRSTYGHWEIDTVYSGKDKSKTALLVLSERMTREELIYKIPNRKAETVLKVINKIERKLGAKTFRTKFKTITADNGSEFALHKEIEHSCINAGYRTAIYFCHPYRSGERGTNENTNKLIRKYIPKGEDISKYTTAQIKEIESKINNYPREMFGGLSANEYKALCNINI